MQLEIGMSTSRYLPANGTAGFARSFVRGNSRVPWPPPMMTESTLLVLIDCRPVSGMNFFLFFLLHQNFYCFRQIAQAASEKRSDLKVRFHPGCIEGRFQYTLPRIGFAGRIHA